MTLQEKALTLLRDYPLCDYCLGRQFSNLATGTTNLNRGKTIKDFLAMEFSAVFADNQIEVLQNLSRSGSELAKKYLTKKEILADETTKCYICEDSLEKIEELANLIVPHTEGYEFHTFLIGTIIPKSMLERETELKKQYDVVQTELLKQEFNRNVGKKLYEKLSVTTDFKSPEIVVEIDPFSEQVVMRIKSLYIYGKYKKFLRTIPQTRWPCRKCKGRGCDACDNTGKKHQESVEELIEVKAMELANADKITLHGGGREDIDALMLGTGRPCVFEIVNPRVRSINLEELKEKINEFAQDKIEVLDLRWSTRKEVVHVKKSAEKAVKKYRALVSFEKLVTDEDMKEIEKEFQNKELQQRTPHRVSHRRADKIREKKVYSIECTRKDTAEIEIIVECDGGCYVKELISGDEGRTKPSISEVCKNSAVCKELDVIAIKEIPYMQKED